MRRERAAERPGNLRAAGGRLSGGNCCPINSRDSPFCWGPGRCLLADEMGLGKTVQALAFLAVTAAYPAILVVPPHLVRNWQREIGRFLPDGHIAGACDQGADALTNCPRRIFTSPIICCSRGWKDVLPELGLQNGDLRRNAGAAPQRQQTSIPPPPCFREACENVIGLSGTPIYNHGGEIWNVVNILDFHFLGDWESFTREWCYGYRSAIVAKPELLGEHLRREGLMLRRVKSDVLTELQPKRRLVQEIDWDDKVYRELMPPVAEKLRLLAGHGRPRSAGAD